jgi:hypothetical protein
MCHDISTAMFWVATRFSRHLLLSSWEGAGGIRHVAGSMDICACIHRLLKAHYKPTVQRLKFEQFVNLEICVTTVSSIPPGDSKKYKYCRDVTVTLIQFWVKIRQMSRSVGSYPFKYWSFKTVKIKVDPYFAKISHRGRVDNTLFDIK